MTKLVCKRVENTEDKGENADNQHFLLFPQCFHKLTPRGRFKLGMCGKGLKHLWRLSA